MIARKISMYSIIAVSDPPNTLQISCSFATDIGGKIVVCLSHSNRQNPYPLRLENKSMFDAKHQMS